MTRAVVVAAVAALVVASGGGAMPFWTGERTVAGGLAVAPDVAVNASGRAIATWDDEVGPDCATAPASLTCIHTVAIRDKDGAGALWGGGAEVAKPGVDARPRVALDAEGDAAVLWVHDIGADRVVQAAVRDGPSGRWPNAEDLSKEVHSVAGHDIALDDGGDAVAVWVQRADAGVELRVAVRPAARRFWGAARLLSTGPVTGGVDLSVTGGGDAIVVWVQGGIVQASRGDIRSDAWGPAVPISRSVGEALGDPVVATNARGEALAAWRWHDRPRGDPVVQGVYAPAGAGWTGPTDLSDAGAGASNAPQVALAADGDGLATWLAPPGPALWSAAVTHAGEWSRAVAVVPGPAAEPDLATDPSGNAVAVWVDLTSSTVRAAARPAAARAWQSPVTLSQLGASAPQVAVDASGRGVAVWNQGAGDRVAIMGADLLGDWEPTLANRRRPTIVGTPRPGRTLVCRPGAWDGTLPIRYAYAWLRDGRPVGAADRATYALRRADARRRLACRVTATNAAGAVRATSRPVRVRVR